MRVPFAARILAAAFCLPATYAADYRPPAGTRQVVKRPGGESILPGGRFTAPLGRQFQTGPGPWGLAISPNGKRVVSADGGPRGFSLTLLDNKSGAWRVEHREATNPKPGEPEDADDFRSVFMGLAFENNDDVYASEGNSGHVRLLDISTGKRKHLYNLNADGFSDSYTGDIAHDAKRHLLYVVDQANFRVAIIDTRKQRIVASVRTGRLPFAITLSPDAKRVYVTNIGMFEYSAIPGASKDDARATGLPFSAFGFPSKESEQGAERTNAAGQTVKIPGLGSPNVKESNSLTVIDVEDPANPKVLKFIPTGLPFGQGTHGGSSPSAVAAHDTHIYVANGHNDSITVINATSLEVEDQILLRIPGLEALRGILPTGLAIALPPGYELQVRPRSGLALKNGIVLPNSPGTVDEDYRGELQVIVMNAGDQPFTVERGARIAQAVLAPVLRVGWAEVETLDETARNEGGFGSTGTKGG